MARRPAPLPRRICFFVGTHGDRGGAGRILFNLVRHLDRSRFEPVVMLRSEGPIEEELRSRGIEHVVWGGPARGAAGWLARLPRALAFYRRQGISLVHLNHACLGWRPAEVTAARMAGVPVVVHSQQPIDKPSPDVLGARLVLSCSQFLTRVSKTGPVPHRVLYDIVETSRLGAGRPARDELGMDTSHVVISFVGRTRRRKGLEMFIDMACRLQGAHLRFLVTGQRVGVQAPDSYTAEEIAALVARDPRIRYLGFREDIENIYATSDVLVMPSQADEPCAAVLIEAGAASRPVVATDTGSTPEFIVEGDNGFLVGRSDLEALVARVQALADDAALRQAMGLRARRRVDERFTHQPVREVEQRYEELLAGRTPA